MRKLLKFIALEFGYCFHPSFAIEVFHFSVKDADGRYTDALTCGYLCNLCFNKVNIPLCSYRGICPRKLRDERQ